jgi:VanZ family protein
VLPLVWAVIVCILHLVKVDIDPDREKLIPHADKIVHFSMFAVLSFLLLRSLIFHHKVADARTIFLTIFVCLIYGALMECSQTLSNTRRSADIYDWLADGLGAVSGSLFATTRWLRFFFHH